MFDRWIEALIRQAQEEGKFDDLPGKGQPLDLGDNPHEDPAQWAANNLLKKNGFAPEWIEMGREMRETLGTARAALVRSREWRNEELAALGERSDLRAQRERDQIAAEWGNARRRFREAIEKLNKQIALFNLKVPVARLQLLKLDPAREFERLGILNE